MSTEGCGIGITALGVSLPALIRRNEDWEHPPAVIDVTNDTPDNDPFRGAVERRVIEPDQESTDLEIEACRSALSTAGLSGADVDLLLGFSQTPRHLQPGNHGPVARGLNLGTTATMMTVDASCASFAVQLKVARSLLASGEHQRAVLYQSSAISRTTDYANPLSPVSGDGAVAEVVGRVDPGLGLIAIQEQIRPDLCDAMILASTDGRRRWTDPSGAGSYYYALVDDADAAQIMARQGPEFAAQTCGAALKKHGYEPRDVDFFLCTLPTVWFADACAAAVGVPPDRVVRREDHFEKYAHLLAASAPLNLWVAWQKGRLKIGDLVLMYLQGSGFTQAAVLLRWAVPPPVPA